MKDDDKEDAEANAEDFAALLGSNFSSWSSSLSGISNFKLSMSSLSLSKVAN